MKKIISCFILTIMLCLSGFAQDCKHEITIEYGQATAPQFIYGVAYVLGTAFTLGQWHMDDIQFRGALGIEYNYWINDVFAVGGTFSHDAIRGTTTNDDGTITENNFICQSLNVIGKAKWLDRKYVDLYSKLGVGAALTSSNSDNSWMPSFQLTAVGCDFGGEYLRGMVEFGVGFQGVINLGIKYRL